MARRHAAAPPSRAPARLTRPPRERIPWTSTCPTPPSPFRRAWPPLLPGTTTPTGRAARRSTASRARSSTTSARAAGSGCASPRSTAAGARACSSLAVANMTLCASGGVAGTFFYVTTPGFGAMTLTRHGTEEQKQRILPGLATGEPAVLPRAHRARRRQQRDRDHDRRPPRRRRVRHQGPEGLDLQRRERRLDGRRHPDHPRGRDPRAGAAAHRRVHPVPRRRPEGARRRDPLLHAHPEDGQQHPALEPGLPRRRTGAGRERHRRGRRRLRRPVGRAQPRAHPCRVRRHRHGGRRAAHRQRLRPRARGLRPPHRGQPGPAVPARPDQGEDRDRPADDLQGGLALRPGPALRQRGERRQDSPAPRSAGRPPTRPSRPSAGWPTRRSTRSSGSSATPGSRRTSPSPRSLVLAHIGTAMLGLPKSY
ncbi:acyl-CoA dehydrogenase family protein [Nocardioides convexus]|uniref:acyl-CoA dehydrogenase family protein n=1 Tax=Nocardioides convexus TaxID=2712224 RepID=UPI0024184A07|nr:acyl-CoA dehydrogenase family protein [Nocardioides convexus]